MIAGVIVVLLMFASLGFAGLALLFDKHPLLASSCLTAALAAAFAAGALSA